MTDTAAQIAAKKKATAEAKVVQDKKDTIDWVHGQGFADSISVGINSIPGMKEIFAKAVELGWNTSAVGQQNFINAVQANKWVQDNGAFMLTYQKQLAQNTDSKTGKPNELWLSQVEEAKSTVRTQAVKLGAELDDNALTMMANAYMMNGWKTRPQFLDQALTGQLKWTDGGGVEHSFGKDFLNYGKGSTATTIASLKNLALNNGLNLSEGYFQSAARAVDGHYGSIDDYSAEIRAHAASANPVVGDKIKAGFNFSDIASPYLQAYADTLGVPLNQIKLSDPLIQQAFGQIDSHGNPQAMGLWDFKKTLKADARWQYTEDASKQVGDMTQSILKMFGYGG